MTFILRTVLLLIFIISVGAAVASGAVHRYEEGTYYLILTAICGYILKES